MLNSILTFKILLILQTKNKNRGTIMKVYKTTNTFKKVQKKQSAKDENTNKIDPKTSYTARTMFDDLSKWESFVNLLEDKNENI